MNMTNMKNAIKRLVVPLVVGGMMWFGGSATAQDIINIYSLQNGHTYTAAGDSIGITFRLYGRFALTNNNGGTSLSYPQVGVVVNGDISYADWGSFSANYGSSGWYTDITFQYKVKPGDMAAPVRLYGYSGSGSSSGAAYLFAWNGWGVQNLDTGSNAVWQVNYGFAESGFGLNPEQLNFGSQRVTIRTLAFDESSSPTTVAATDTTTWHVTTADATLSAVPIHVFTTSSNIVQVGTVSGQWTLPLTMSTGSTNIGFTVKGLASGTADIYVMREQTYAGITNISLPSSFTNFIKRTITVNPPPAPRVSVLMSTSGTDTTSLNEGTYQTFIVQLSEARTNAVDVQVTASSGSVLFGVTNYTSTVTVRVPANSTSSSPVRFNAMDGGAYVELTPTVVSTAADYTYFTDARSGYVTVANVNPTVTAKLTSSTYATRGKSCPFSWTATDVAADTNSGMTVSWDFGDGTITNVTGAVGVISHMFTTSSSGRTVVVTATDKDGGSSSYSFSVEVRDPEPQPTVRVVSSPTLCSETNGTGQLVVTLSQSYPGDVYVKLTATIDGQGQNCLFFGTTNTTKVVRILQGDTNSATVVYSIADGTDATYDPGVDITPAVTNAGPDTYFTSLYPLTLRIKNEAPVVTLPTSRDDTLGPSPAYTNVYMGRPFQFNYAVSDVVADQSSLVLTWDFGDSSGNLVVTGYQGYVSHTFASLGTKYVQVQAVDKDGAKSALIRFPISVVPPPPAPTVRVLSPSGLLSETTMPRTGSIIIQLSESFTNDVAVGLTVTPTNSFANGAILLSTNRVVFRPSEGLEKTVYVSALDGTDISTLNGFTVTPTVLPETPAAQAYYKILDPGYVNVMNVNPTIQIPSSTAGTTNISTVVAQNVPWAFSWTVIDVVQDMYAAPVATAMTIYWDFGDGGSLTTYGGIGTNAVHTYTSSGEKTVTMTARDKDGGSSFVQFKVLVKESKELLVVPVGPDTSSGYGASGYGTVSSPEARSLSMIGSTYDFLYNPDTTRIKVIATPVTAAGYDSFFYTWIGDTSLGFLAQDLSPYTSASLYPTNGGIGGASAVVALALPDLSTASSSSSSSSASPKIYAIFSREKYPADNMGDINLDGIPDKFAFAIEKSLNSGSGTASSTQLAGMTDLSTFNDDLDKVGGTAVGDYLPINPTGTGGKFDFRPVSDGTGNNDFSALLEVRGKDPALNMVIGGVRISDPVGPFDEPYTDPMLADTDGDGLPDGWEYYFWYNATINHMTGSKYDPLNVGQGIVIPEKDIQLAFEPSQMRADIDGDGHLSATADASRDFDNDGLLDREELVLGTNPVNWDTDGDGVCDTWEIMRGTDPCASNGNSNPDGDYMAYASVKRLMITVVQGGTTTNTYLAPVGTPGSGRFSGTVATWYHYGSDTDPIAEGYPLVLTDVPIVSSVSTNVLIMHFQVMREFGFDPRTAWTSALNNEQHPTRWPAWLADAVNTKPFTTRDEYLLIKFMSANRINGASTSMAATYSVWKAYSTDPLTPDSDATKEKQDGMPDGWELYVSIDPTADLTVPANRTMRISPWNALDGDLDHPIAATPPRDGLINRREFAGTDSSAAYTNSALYISTNVFAAGTVTINRPASDANWINKFWPTNPWAQDTDGDGLDDLAEFTFVYGTPVDNGTSCIQGGGLNPNSVDTDLDALPDAWEFEFRGTAPTNSPSTTYTTMAITNGMDGTFADADQDWDADGLKNYQEYWVQAIRGFRYDIPDVGVMSGPVSKNIGVPMDSNSDPYYLFTAVSNSWDRAQFPWGTLKPQLYILLPPAGHVYNNAVPLNLYASTDPRLPDTDGDGMDDYYEMFHGLNPILGDLMENAKASAVDLSKDRIAKAYFNGFGEPIVIGPNVFSYFHNDWDSGINLDFTKRPWMTGLPEVDPDADGLLNLEERLLPNTAAPSYSNTDPTPIWLTDTSNTNSVTSRFYQTGDANMFFWPPYPEVPPKYVYDFEINEGYDTDNDGISDKAEMVASKNALSDPQDSDDPVRRQAIWFSGTNSAASSFSGFAYGVWTLRSFTVELWARPEVVTNSEQVLIERTLSFAASDLSNQNTNVVRRNFRVGIAADGRVYGMFENTGSHDETTASVRVYGETLTANKWVHLAIRMDGAKGVFTLLVNGQVAATMETTLIPATGTLVVQSDAGTPDTSRSYTVLAGAVVLGAANQNPQTLIDQTWSDYTCFYRGSLDEVRIWDGARSNDEIRDNYKKRFVRDDLLNNRLTVRAQELVGYSRVWTNPLQLAPELLFHYTFDNLFGADSTNNVAVAPRGFEDARVATNRPSDAAVGWWSGMATKSVVYTDYNYLPWIENSVEHLPVYNELTSVVTNGSGLTILLTNGVADSVYWSYTMAGKTPGTYKFPNSNNPYGFCYGSTGIASDLLPLGDAFPKQLSEMWDGNGASGVWNDTLVDSDSDGLPDWWELYVTKGVSSTSVAWDAINPVTGVSYGIQYQRDIAKGMTASNNPQTNPGGWTATDSNGDGTYDSATANSGNSVIVQTADTDGDGMPDWWENLYNLNPASAKGDDGALGDPDRDGLSNLAEYMISEVYGFYTLNPKKFKTNANQLMSDYFLPQGKLTLGAMFSDHDFMEDSWEDQYSPSYVSRYVYDADKDNDEDGWSNWSECRYRKFSNGTRPDVSMTPEILGLMAYEFPVPIIETTLRYNGDFNGGSIVLQFYSDQTMSGTNTATYVVPNDSATTTVKTQPLGYWSDRIVETTLSPGSIQPGTISLSFTDLWTKKTVSTGFDNDGVLYSNNTDGTWDPIGTIDYVTGKISLDLWYYDGSRIVSTGSAASTNRSDYVECSTSYVQMKYTVHSIATWPKTVYLGMADSGYVHGGTNYVFAFLDLNKSGAWDAGEPCGVATPFANDIGWDYNWLNIQLTDRTPGYLRLSLSSKLRSEDVFAGVSTTTQQSGGGGTSANSASAIESRIRVLRRVVDGYTTYQRIVLDKVIQLPRYELHEGDLMGQGDLALDWGLPDIPNSLNRAALVYDVYVGNATVLTNNTLVTTFTNTFDLSSDRAVATNSSPINGQYVYTARPTFKWFMPNSYNAFAIEVRKGSSSGSLVYQSGTVQTPMRDQITGECIWKAPICAGDMWTNGQIFASANTNSLYAWRVIALNAKYTITNTPVTWSGWKYFRLDVNAAPSSSGYGELRAAVKYYGIAKNYLHNRVKVQVFRTASFTGDPEQEYTLSDADLVTMTNVVVASGTNAVMRGLMPSTTAGNYYVRAYIDQNLNGVRDPWESWGYANYYGVNDTPYSPRPFTVTTATSVDVANIIIEDADTDQDWFPDAWEYEQHPGDPNFLALTGPASTWVNGDTEVNPFLVTNGTQTVSQMMGITSLGLLSPALTDTTDADGDGISDMVELVLGSDANSASTVNDGYSDYSKYSLGLNPSDTLAFKVTSIAVNGSTLNLTWDVSVTAGSTSGNTLLNTAADNTATYVVEYTASLADANWQSVSTGKLTLKTGVQSVESDVSALSVDLSAGGFFRVRLIK